MATGDCADCRNRESSIVNVMKLAERFPFYDSLGNPILTGGVDHTATPCSAKATAVTAQWGINVETDDSPDAETIRVAAEDLHRILEAAFGVRVPLDGGLARGNRIRLQAVKPGTLGSNLPEAYRLTVTEDAIVIEGNTGAGVLHGVFHLEDLMREHGAPCVERGVSERAPLFERRIHRSAVSPFYVEELAGYDGIPYKIKRIGAYDILFSAFAEEDAGPEGYYADPILLGLARHGFNGIWIRGCLRRLTATALYPAGAADAEKALPRLRDLCRRAAVYGIGVYVYLNEPMGFPEDDPFWLEHPELKGTRTRLDSYCCLCTSQPQVLDYLREGMHTLFSRVPELAGTLLITASEFPTHCWSHSPAPNMAHEASFERGTRCPRCAGRDPCEVVAEVVTQIRAGMKAAKPDADLIAWNWAWNRYEPDPQAGILARLPPDVVVMGNFEAGTPARALEAEYVCEEYNLKVVGPSPRFSGVVAHQRRLGTRTYAKLQIGTTHENPTVPYLPVLPSIGLKYRALAESGVAGMMTCWNFGNMPCIATEAANAFAWAPQDQTVDETLRRVASRYVGMQAAPVLVKAWRMMHDSMQRAHPGTIPFLYNSPLSRGPAFPWTMERLNRPFPPGWLLVDDAHADHMDPWLEGFGAEHVVRCLRTLDEDWTQAVGCLESALPLTRGSGTRELEREIGVARMCIIQFRSTLNMIEFLLTRNEFDAAEAEDEQAKLNGRIREIAERERENCAAALPLVDADPRLGFHGEAHGYLFDRPLIERKIAELDEMIRACRID
ncbi:MAG: hypothetical protein JXR37_24530 [Kiritimatiellae bacterium]|nr:hypothetical protein [Kiritimatiellia bacterium]